ncbi:hypothetical protein JQ557_24850 [Bradyrhizobium sp. U87765 SZCCT0131]|uniref:hypothetical protein n=1 Tax=unclassified Bradyrhizobium TaxID=2631580 RepID=UPI001BAD8877|nr:MULTISPECIES: hypothetical protein [unclassified Bradyrhizobium]MBR1221252.1 hypothetical protein [Bradyrhizobium sp. U87765 SZCCT0131]MBR1259927.1 hypothetical protein [Bradyrhizobium sp. U87765 SZCCT0134]MBR1307824.1 hypothetical protein [Bradyrhizobium sp. U87765 SZCCT0110]MBR1321778.1 hypothetical protein [Bradyrhizobium sp. U87765 SZCCT0109]MBR1350090.1 hypothetical protein [Bradyrhizobium sp. U87765 SZCCT0048]
MSVDSAGNGDSLARRVVRWLGAATGLITVGLGSTAAPAVAQRADFQSATAAPAAWQAFARQLQSQFQQQLAADDTVARQVRDGIAGQAVVESGRPSSVVVRTWILPSGRVERVDFDGLEPDVAAPLRALLARDNVGAPPADMLQPLHLRLSLQPRESQEH